jgi:hypothetical protein
LAYSQQSSSCNEALNFHMLTNCCAKVHDA